MKFWPMGLRMYALIAIFALVMTAVPSFAQSAFTRLHGQVADPSGAVIPGATISVKDSSGAIITAKSDGAGGYEVRNLAPGKYTVRVSAKNFVPVVQEVEIGVGQDKKLDVSLEIFVKEESVDVQGDAAKVSTNPDNNASTLVMSGKDLDALSDDPDELQSELQALAGPSAGPNGGQIYIDGFTGGQLPPKSSIREIRINQNPFSAQYDRMGYGRIEILTKPGTDKLHGQFFFNDNHSFLDARNPFAASEPDFNTEMINGSVGGPLSKKASYQVSVERRNINEAAVITPAAFTASGVPVVAVLNPRTRTNLSARLDYQLATNNTVTVRYQFTNDDQKNNGIGQLALPSQAFNQSGNEQSIQVSDTQILSPKAINETRFEWERGTTDQHALVSTPAVNVLGQFTEGGNPLGTFVDTTNHYELQNYTSINLNTHFLRLGGRLRATADSNFSTKNFNGLYTFDSLSAFQSGTPRQLVIVTGNPLVSNTYVDAGIYGEDDWKIRPNMTLSYGLRFETQNGIHDNGDWAPRISFAWGLGGKKNAAPKTVLRTGLGIFYDRFGQNLILQAERLNGLNQQQLVIKNPSYPNPPSLSTLAATPLTLQTIDPALRTPYTVQLAASVERQLTKSATVTATYLHVHGVHQLFSSVVNTVPAPQYQYESGGVFNQNQFITNFNMRVGTKITVSGFYSLSYANSDSGGAGSFASNPALGIKADYGRAGFDVRNRLFFFANVSLPHGFRVSPFVIANSGAPFNIITGQDLNGDSIFNDRPAFATDLSRSSVVQTNFGAFDTAPIAGQALVPINFGTSPAQFTFNMRLSKTIGIGPKLDAGGGPDAQQQRGQGGTGGPRGGPGGMGGRGPEGGRGGEGPRGGGGPMMGGGPERSSQRYSLTFSANARNIFNNVNPAPPIGNLSSRLFGQSTSLAGGPFNTQSANRRIDLQVVFSF
ncbi:MAG TPA: carboxypeptidase regulatory-like domain-containing protein [Candidatus Angelobacter sp.]|nr:carboxypeptidase regulatory-like domain-containing protein [Candidatus Angelobacter sp.]